MKFYQNYNLLILNLIYFCIIQRNAVHSHTISLHKVIKTESLHQITSFVSENFTKISDQKIPFTEDTPNKIHSFGSKHQMLYDDSSLKNTYYLQESLIIFYTSNLNETKSFIDYLIPQLTVGMRPKCLILHSSNHEESEEIDVAGILKYAWNKKFLDFSILVTGFSNDSIYYLNPFNAVVYRKEVNDNVEMFPDKLGNAYGYEIFISKYSDYSIDIIREPGRMAKFIPGETDFLFFTAKILNISLVKKYHDFISIDDIYDLERYDLDVVPRTFHHGAANSTYLEKYIPIPADVDASYENIFALVPILPSNRINLTSSMLIIVLSIGGIIFVLKFLFKLFRSSEIGVFDVVLLLLGQSIANEPNKAALRLVYLTVIVAGVKLVNDFLLDIILIQFEYGEVPFETYEDLWNSRLKTYSNEEDFENYDPHHDPYLTKIIKNTGLVFGMRGCIETLKKWKNVSCICGYRGLGRRALNFLNSDGTAVMKVAEPPISTTSVVFYLFGKASPFAMKFLEIIRRVKETDFIRWEIIFTKRRSITTLIEKTNDTTADGIELRHLVFIVCIGFMISSVVLFVEIILSKIAPKSKNFRSNR